MGGAGGRERNKGVGGGGAKGRRGRGGGGGRGGERALASRALGSGPGAAPVPDLSEAQPVGQDPVHSVRLHLGPLQLEAKDARTVLPQSCRGVVVELRSVGLP